MGSMHAVGHRSRDVASLLRAPELSDAGSQDLRAGHAAHGPGYLNQAPEQGIAVLDWPRPHLQHCSVSMCNQVFAVPHSRKASLRTEAHLEHVSLACATD